MESVKTTYSVKVPISETAYRQISRHHTIEDARKALDFCVPGAYILKETAQIVQTKEK